MPFFSPPLFQNPLINPFYSFINSSGDNAMRYALCALPILFNFRPSRYIVKGPFEILLKSPPDFHRAPSWFYPYIPSYRLER